MSKEKNNRTDLYLEKKDANASSEDNTKNSKKLEARVVSFDLYFQMLMKKNPKVYAHHKAPMRQFAEAQSMLEGSEENFDKLFKSY